MALPLRTRPYQEPAIDDFRAGDRLLIDGPLGTGSMDLATFASRLSALGDLAQRLDSVVQASNAAAALREEVAGLVDLVENVALQPKSVDNAKLADMAANTVKGALADGRPVDLTVTQVKALLALAVGDVSGLTAALAAKAAQADLTALQAVTGGKLDASTFTAYRTANDNAVAARALAADLTTAVNNLTAAIATKLDAAAAAGFAPQVGGKIPSTYIPSIAITDTFYLLPSDALTGNATVGAETGDVAIVYDPNDPTNSKTGTYILTGDRTQVGNWKLLRSPLNVVSSGDIQGITGIGQSIITAADANAVKALLNITTTAIATSATDTYGLIGAAGSQSNVQALLDKIASRQDFTFGNPNGYVF